MLSCFFRHRPAAGKRAAAAALHTAFPLHPSGIKFLRRFTQAQSPRPLRRNGTNALHICPHSPIAQRAQRSAFGGRKQKKRDFRKLWIARINAAARQNNISYSRLINGLKLANVEVNRKMLADLAVNDAAAFAQLAEVAKSKLA